MKLALHRDGGRYNPYAPPSEPDCPNDSLRLVLSILGLALTIGGGVAEFWLKLHGLATFAVLAPGAVINAYVFVTRPRP